MDPRNKRIVFRCLRAARPGHSAPPALSTQTGDTDGPQRPARPSQLARTVSTTALYNATTHRCLQHSHPRTSMLVFFEKNSHDLPPTNSCLGTLGNHCGLENSQNNVFFTTAQLVGNDEETSGSRRILEGKAHDGRECRQLVRKVTDKL